MDKIVQNYYGGGNKYDPRAQAASKKHYCAICKIEISASRSSIMFHEQSKQHQQKKKETIDRSRGRNNPDFQNDPTKPQRVNMQQLKSLANNAMMEEMKRIEEAAFSTYDKKDATGFRYKKLNQAEVLVSLQQQQNAGARRNEQSEQERDMGYQKPKQSQFEEDSGSSFNIDDIKNEPIWSSHYDEDSGEVYYYNRLKKNSQWDRPKNFDGYEIMSGQQSMNQDSVYQRTFGGFLTQQTSMPTLLENKGPTDQGVVGGWVEVKDDFDYYKQNSVQNFDQQKLQEIEKKELECKPKTREEIIDYINQNSDSEELAPEDDQQNAMDKNQNEEEDDDEENEQGIDLIRRQLMKQKDECKIYQKSILGKRKLNQRSNKPQLVNATDNDILKESIKDMKIRVEKGTLNEDFSRINYAEDKIVDATNNAQPLGHELDSLNKIRDDGPASVGGSTGFGFKKREQKNVKKRQAVTSDGEKD
ncbi:UNKNOWN [Stylonychia lemnae]|uniref:WW domain-containing protein n=1 Tax=Stylonychia lemnae TaxID=5949 RepID=A0A078BB96_STYLE|nr:UNKNOWN [Stylonychia lemnae]|eukprot:CDW91664.1 UNKNOWN [Stylonychia lemnae]